MEDPLDDMGMVSQQLEKVSAIARCDYGKTCALLVALLDAAATGYQELPPTCHDSQRLVCQGCFLLLSIYKYPIRYLILIFRSTNLARIYYRSCYWWKNAIQ